MWSEFHTISSSNLGPNLGFTRGEDKVSNDKKNMAFANRLNPILNLNPIVLDFWLPKKIVKFMNKKDLWINILFLHYKGVYKAALGFGSAI